MAGARKKKATKKVVKLKQHTAGSKKRAAKSAGSARVRKPAASPRSAPPEPPRLKLPADERKHYASLLLQLRDRLLDGINFLAGDNLRSSQREAAGDISNYGTHMADAGTDSFDREFALSLVSNEQEALYEVEEALKRLEEGTYGICQVCEKPIGRQRLEVLPFARLCVKCQASTEKDQRRPSRPLTAFPQFEETEETEAEGEEEHEEL